MSGMSSKLRVEMGAGELISELEAMINNPDLSDLCLLCKDGVTVHACRILLMARSPVLRKMLSNGMAESHMSQISLPSISSSALLPTLEYLYTGNITKHEMELDTALRVFHAATFFQIAPLAAHLKPLLCSSISSISKFPTLLAQHLSTLVSYGIVELLDNVISIILVSLRSSCCMTCPTTFLCYLSSEAMQLLFKSMETKNVLSIVRLSFMEYIRLRSLLLWGASLTSSEAEAFFVSALPDEDSLKIHFNALKSSGKTYLEVGLQREEALLLTDEEMQCIEDVKAFLEKAGWTCEKLPRLVCIHPVILLTVLKPLNIIDLFSNKFKVVLQYQAFRMGEMNVVKWVLPQDGYLYYNVQENGALLLGNKVSLADEQMRAFAFANISFTKPNGIYEMKFIVEELAPTMKIVVFCLPAYSMNGPKLTLVGGLSWQSGRLQALAKSTGYSLTCLNSGDQIRVVLDMSKQECKFQIKGNKAVFENIFGEVLLAAYCLAPGKLRIVLVSENTFL